MMKIGIITDCMKKANLEEALIEAAELGVDGVQIYAVGGEFSPQTLTAERKRKLKKILREKNLSVSALCADFGGFGFEKEQQNAERIAKTKAIVDLAVEFETNVVTTHIGVIPRDKSVPRYQVMLRAVAECGLYAKERGVTLAIETGPERAITLKHFIDDTQGGVGVNLDPANFTMVTGQDAEEAVYILRDDIVHTHVKDGRKLDSHQTAEEVYHAFAVGGVDALNACKGFEELPIGQGDVDWENYLRAFNEIGYDGYLTIEREAGQSPMEDIRGAVAFIANQLHGGIK